MNIEQRQKFYDNNIPYDDIDEEMINILDILNFQLEYKTKFCCYGHSKNELTSIMFDTCVSDEMIYKLIQYLHETGNFFYKKSSKTVIYGTFQKWARYIDDIAYLNSKGKICFNGNETLVENWMWKGCFSLEPDKAKWLKKICKNLRDFKP